MKMMIYGVLGIIGAVGLWFIQPYSFVEKQFQQEVEEQTKSLVISDTGVFTEEDLVNLPHPVQRYFRYCGFIGTEKMSYSIGRHHNADFGLGRGKPQITIEYTQVNFVKEPVRLAFVDSRMYGVPFQGYDRYLDGVGSMKGVLGKAITLFDQRGTEMDQASLVNVLAESLFCPNIALQDYITWEPIDDTHAKATISYYGISASGEFTFSEEGEMLSFTTMDRYQAGDNGVMKNIPWSAVLGEYKEIKGIKTPTVFQGIWHEDEGDYVYFDGKDTRVEYCR